MVNLGNAAIILGNKLRDDGKMTPALRERLYRGLSLWREGKCDCFILCGGRTNSLAPLSEAAAMKEYLLSEGVPEGRMLLDERSLNTYQNAAEADKILSGKVRDKLYLVTSAKHMYRPYFNPVAFFERKFKQEVIPTPSFDCGVEEVNVAKNGESILIYYGSKRKLREFIANNLDKNIYAKKKCGFIREGFLPKPLGKAGSENRRKLEKTLAGILGTNLVSGEI